MVQVLAGESELLGTWWKGKGVMRWWNWALLTCTATLISHMTSSSKSGFVWLLRFSNSLQHCSCHRLTLEFHFCVMEHKVTDSMPGIFESSIIRPRVLSSFRLVSTGVCHLSWSLGRRGYGLVRISRHRAWNLHMNSKTWGLTCLQCPHPWVEKKEQEAMYRQLTPFAS